MGRAAASVPMATGLSDRATSGVRQARRRAWMVSGIAAAAVVAVTAAGFGLAGRGATTEPPVAVGGATSQPPQPTEQAPSAKTVTGTWNVLQIAGQKSLKAPRPDNPVLRFRTDGTWSGSDGCNGIQGTYTIGQRGEFSAKAGPQRLIGCNNVPHSDVLQSAKRIAISAGKDSDTLAFYAANGHELARYARAR
nr:META domain-containing protein [Kribbella sandramycini]